MKKKLLLASLLACASAATFSACSLTEKLPTWMGGMGDAYYVTITINGEETSVKVAEDAIPEKPADPVKEGYNFRGWYLDAAGETKYNFDEPLNADSTLYAIFDEKEYVITFVVDGVATPVTFTWSQTPTFETPKKDKYVFKNWCIDEALESPFAFTQPVRTDMTVYAKFAEAYKVQYVVTPNLETENEDEINTEIVETEKETAPIKPRDPDVEGYTFEGWFLDKEFTTAYNFDTILEEGQTVYAKLVEKQYTVTYAVVGDEEPLSTVTYNYWDIPEEPETPEHNGEYFFGWYLDTEYTNSYDFSYTLKTDTTVYAQFLESKPIFTLEELIAIKDYPAGNYALQNDISLKLKTWEQIPEFSGKFDGNGYKIYDFTMSTTTANSGFFVTNNGTIKNLTLESFSFTSNCFGSTNVGALVGVNNGTVENCTINNPVVDNENGITYRNQGGVSAWGPTYKSYYGGMIGYNAATAIVKNCTVIVDMVMENSFSYNCGDEWDSSSGYMYYYCGGAIGANLGEVSGVSTTFTLARPTLSDGSLGVTATGSGNGGYSSRYPDNAHYRVYVGGVVSSNSGTMTRCDSTVDITTYCTAPSYGYPRVFLGGFVFQNSGTITQSVSRGVITNEGSANELGLGGFAYENTSTGSITDCYSDTTINANSCGGYVGGFVAYNSNIVERCYALGAINSTSTGYVGGFVAYMNTNAQVKASFTGMNITATTTKLGVYVGGFVSEASSFSRCYYATEVTVTQGEEAYVSTTVSGVNTYTTEQLYSTAILESKMYWNDAEERVWVIDGVNAPTLVWENA